MKILFIYPNEGSQLGFNYGVAHIAAILKKAGHKVELLQFSGEIGNLPSKDEFCNSIKQINPDLIGFSVVTNQWPYTKKLAAWVRYATDVPVVCGGIHAMASAREILQSGLFDYIIRGEAEDAFLEFVEKLAGEESVQTVRNLGLVKDGEILINPMRPLPNLKKLPPKDYDIFDFQKIIDAKNDWVGLMGSRGCPSACTYCFNHQVVAQYRKDLNCSFKQLNYIRHFDVKDVINEIKYLVKNYKNIKMFIFDDDLFTFYKDYVKDFCREYKKTSDIPFVVNAHVGFFDEDRARFLSEANCKIVKFGVESGSERIREKVLHRRMKNTKIIKAIETAQSYGLHTSVFLMIGLPDETYDDLMATITLMSKTVPGRYRWSFFYPFPGTKAYDFSFKLKTINSDKMAKMSNFTQGSCLDFGHEHNLLLKKVGLLMPWFVNAYSSLPVADFYKRKIETILQYDSEKWDAESENLFNEDKLLSDNFVKKGLRHYAIKYNPFMGVISDYFVSEN
ncbi:MAG: B12-binding domain-containing radical SAM protein [Deltaproteobacteria bacterium]|nr:B12-binding domain-containing radical SAM protein [Deltaproteobacteria bacterium]